MSAIDPDELLALGASIAEQRRQIATAAARVEADVARFRSLVERGTTVPPPAIPPQVPLSDVELRWLREPSRSLRERLIVALAIYGPGKRATSAELASVVGAPEKQVKQSLLDTKSKVSPRPIEKPGHGLWTITYRGSRMARDLFRDRRWPPLRIPPEERFRNAVEKDVVDFLGDDGEGGLPVRPHVLGGGRLGRPGTKTEAA